MKKILLLLVAMLAVLSLAACGNEETPAEHPEETTAQQGELETPGVEDKGENGFLPVDPADFYKFEQFTLPEGDFRDAAVEHMYKMSSIEWTCSSNFSVSEKWENWGISLDFKKGTVYHGIPYADTKVSYDDFMNHIKDGTFTADSTAWKDVLGVQCISSIMNAIQQFDPSVAGTSNQMMPSYKTFEASILGDYKVPEGVNRTIEIIEANGNDKIYECYGLLKKGDIIITKDDTKGTSHFRMLVEDATAHVNGAGRFVPSRSSVKTIEQTNAFDRERPGIHSTWFVDHVYSFEELLNSRYLPLTLDIYNKPRSECEIPYLALDKEMEKLYQSDRLDYNALINYEISVA